MLKNLSSLSRNKSSVFLLVLALIVSGVGAHATGLLNTSAGGYLVCVNSISKVVTHPGKASCPKGSNKLVLGGKAQDGAKGLTGAAGLSGKDGIDGKDGKTLWNGDIDPDSTWGSPGDMFINSVTKTLFGPKELITGWPSGVSIVGPKGDQGPAGAKGSNGANGSNGASAPTVTASNCISPTTTCTYKVGDTGPGGGIIFFVDYNGQFEGINYLEAAPDGWGNGIAVDSNTEQTGSETVDPKMNWCSDKTTFLNLKASSNFGIGRGLTNTDTADTTCAGGALQAAVDYAGGGKTDWFLPSIGETMVMYSNLREAGVGEFVVAFYWSSTEGGATSAWAQSFANGYQQNLGKDNTLYVRPIRFF